jgi:protein SCO1
MQVMTVIPRWLCAIVVLLAIAIAGCTSSRTEDAAKSGPAKEYPLHGEIRGLDAGQHVATIKHDAIPGFMNAMTMGYPVKDQDEFSKLKVGDEINATVYVKDDDMWVGKIQKAQK